MSDRGPIETLAERTHYRCFRSGPQSNLQETLAERIDWIWVSRTNTFNFENLERHFSHDPPLFFGRDLSHLTGFNSSHRWYGGTIDMEKVSCAANVWMTLLTASDCGDPRVAVLHVTFLLTKACDAPFADLQDWMWPFEDGPSGCDRDRDASLRLTQMGRPLFRMHIKNSMKYTKSTHVSVCLYQASRRMVKRTLMRVGWGTEFSLVAIWSRYRGAMIWSSWQSKSLIIK